MRKIERVLRVVLLSVGILSFIGLGLNQWGSFVSLGNEQKSVSEQSQAVQECLAYRTPHAVVIDGKVYCYIVQGQRIASLDYLKSNVEPQEIP